MLIDILCSTLLCLILIMNIKKILHLNKSVRTVWCCPGLNYIVRKAVLFSHFERVLHCCTSPSNLSSLWIWKGSVWSVAFFMLDKVPAPELIAATVENSVLPYAEEHKIPFDDLLLQYIKVKFHHSQACWEQTFNFDNVWWWVFNPSDLIFTRICWNAAVLRPQPFSQNGKPKQWLCWTAWLILM